MLSCALAGCETLTYRVTDGNRAAGTVTLSCQDDTLSICEGNADAMRRQAINACRAWAYSGAQAFAGGTKSEVDDMEYLYEYNYQCTGSLEQ